MANITGLYMLPCRDSFNNPANKNVQTRKTTVFKGLKATDLSSEFLKANFLSFAGRNTDPLTEAKKIAPEYSKYLDKLAYIEGGQLLKDAFNTLNESNNKQKKDFLKACAELNFLEREPVILLAKIASKMHGGSKLEYGLQIQDNWLKKIVTHPHFNEKDKINTIIRSCKVQEMGQIVKRENLFINATPEGNISGQDNFGSPDLGESKAYGLFTNDTLFLSNYELSVLDNGKKAPLKLISCNNQEGKATYNIKSTEGLSLQRDQISNKAFFERISLRNDSNTEKIIVLDIESKVRDLMDVRSMTPSKGPYNTRDLGLDKGVIFNTEINKDRQLGVKVEIQEEKDSQLSTIKPEINNNSENTLSAKVKIKPGESKTLFVKVTPLLNNKPFVNGKVDNNIPANYNKADSGLAKDDRSNFSEVSIRGQKDLKDSGQVLSKSISDLKLLTNKLHIDGQDYSYIGAGLPRYACLFGRDSIITALEILPINQQLAKDTIKLLAKYQGKSFEDRYKAELSKPGADIKKFQEWYDIQEEAEGKILHELRVGELAREHKIPSTPYYGTVDATPLWLMLISDYHKWTSDDKTVKKLLPNIEKALEWIDKNSPDGFLRFVASDKTKHSIANQGWKDSHDSIKHLLNQEDKISNPEYPIALAEVQGYVYAAKKGIAEVYRKLGDTKKAEKLEKEASALKERFNDKYWVDSKNFIAIALDADGNAVPSVSTNAGQCLTTGIIDDSKAEKVKKVLMSDDMNSGWGIRTLSKNEAAFDEMSYHNGSVWPHDTALVAKGLDRKDTASVTADIYKAASTFKDMRIPELYAGFQKKEGDTSIQTYPEGCSPQAWSAAGVVNLIISCLGIQPDAKNNTLKLVNPVLPEDLNTAKISNLKVNGNSVTLEVEKTPDGNLNVRAYDEFSSDSKNLPVTKEGNSFVIQVK